MHIGAEEPRRKWHLVVDTNCLLDADSLKSLKQLEDIRETRIIIPKVGKLNTVYTLCGKQGMKLV